MSEVKYYYFAISIIVYSAPHFDLKLKLVAKVVWLVRSVYSDQKNRAWFKKMLRILPVKLDVNGWLKNMWVRKIVFTKYSHRILDIWCVKAFRGVTWEIFATDHVLEVQNMRKRKFKSSTKTFLLTLANPNLLQKKKKSMYYFFAHDIEKILTAPNFGNHQ